MGVGVPTTGYVGGGGNLLTISGAIDSAHAFTGTTYGDWDFEFAQIGTLGVTRDPATGYYGFEVTHIADHPTLTTLLETWAPSTTSGEIEEFIYTDGTKIGGTTGAAPDLLGANYGATHTTQSKRKVTAAIVKAQLDAGALDEESGSMTKPAMTFIGQKAKQDVTIPAAMFCTALVSGATDTTILKDTGGKQAWFTAA